MKVNNYFLSATLEFLINKYIDEKCLLLLILLLQFISLLTDIVLLGFIKILL